MTIDRRCGFATRALTAVLVVIAGGVALKLAGIVLAGELFVVRGDWTITYNQTAAVFGGINFLVVVVCAVAFIRWQRHMARVLIALDGEALAPAVGLSTWGWFIPIANLVIPYTCLKETAIRAAADGQRAAASLVAWWWACWLGTFGASMVVVGLQSDEPEPWITAAAAGVISDAPRFLAAVLAIQMVRRLSDQLKQRQASHERGEPGRQER